MIRTVAVWTYRISSLIVGGLVVLIAFGAAVAFVQDVLFH